jgi:ankyrin repeat protein
MATYVRGIPNNFNLEDNLKKLTNDMSTVYGEQLRRVSAQEPFEIALAGLVLSWLYYNTGSMPARQLMEVLQFNFAKTDLFAPMIDLRLVTKVCLDLIRYSESDGMVSFLHFSLYEYLEETHRQHAGSLTSNIPPWTLPNHFLGGVCMQYLFSDALSKPSGSRHALERKLEAHPFYEWASSHWNRLYSASEPDAAGYLKKLLSNDLAVQAIAEVIFQHEDLYWSCRYDRRFPALHFLVYFGIPLEWSLIDQRLSSRSDFLGRTPLHIAAIRNGRDAVTQLSHFYRKQGVDFDRMVRQKDVTGKTLWHYVALGNCVSVASELVDQLGSIEVSTLTTKDIRGMTPLWYAASEGHLEIIEFLLHSRLPELLGQSKEGLKCAIEGGHLEVVKMILETGVKISHDHLIAAIDSGASDVVILLLEYGVDVDNGEATSALHEAARSQKTPILSTLIWNGANLELMDSIEQTPLALAVKQNSVDVVKLLLDAGADPSVQIQRGKGHEHSEDRVSALFYAAENGFVEIFALLTNAGADASSCLMPAVKRGHDTIVSFLMDRDLVGPKEAREAVKVAEKYGHLEVARLLQAEHVQPSIPDATRRSHEEEDVHIYVAKDMRKAKSAVGLRRVQKAPQSTVDEESSHPDNVPTTAMTLPIPSGLVQRPISGEKSLERPRTGQTTHNRELDIEVVQKLRPPPKIALKTRGTVQGVRKTPFILLNDPIWESSLQLGAIVRDPLQPLQSFAPRKQEALRRLFRDSDFSNCIHQTNFTSEHSQTRSTSIGASIGASMFSQAVGVEAHSSSAKAIQVASPDVWRWQLSRHDEALGQIFQDPEFGEECVEYMSAEKTAYLVVGIFVMASSKVASGTSTDRRESLAQAAGVNLSVGWDVPRTSAMRTVTYDDVLIHGVQYRSLKSSQPLFDRLLGANSKKVNLKLGDFLTGPRYDYIA